MRSAGPNRCLIALLFFTAVVVAEGFAADEVSETGRIQNELDGIKMRLADVEKAQKDILTQKDQILQELDRLRVWVRHSGG